MKTKQFDCLSMAFHVLIKPFAYFPHHDFLKLNIFFMKSLLTFLIAILVLGSLYNLQAQNVVILPVNGEGSVQTATSGTLLDSGGEGLYTPGTYGSIVISPSSVSCPLEIAFTEFDLGVNVDFLTLYDGANFDIYIGSYTGDQLPNGGLPIVSTTGSFSIEMYSDIFIFPPPPPVNAGFRAIWQAGDSTADANFTISSNDVPINSPIHFTPNVTEYGDYFWNFGDGNSSTEVNPTHAFSGFGSFTVSLTITNCEGTSATQSVEVFVQEPPAISVEPNSGYDVTLEQGDSTTYSFTITNNGSGDLVYEIEGANLIANKELQVLALLNGADLTQEYPATLQAINNYFTDYQLTEITTTNASELATALQNKDVLLIPEQETCNAAAFGSFAAILQTFAENGGTIIINGTNQSGCIFNTGLFSGTYQNFYSGPLNVSVPTDPIMEGVSNPYDALAVTFYFDITNPDAVRLVQYNGFDVVTYRNIGLGRAILVGHDFRYHNANMDRIMSNCVKTTKDLLSVNGGVDWLYISEDSGTLAPGESVTIDLEFNATDIYGGFFTQNLVINSNDAATPQITIPCNLTVTGTPSFAINESSHDFGEVMENDTARYNITISNPGTDSLKVLGITFSDPVFSADPSNFSLYGGGTSQEVELRFVPTTIAPYFATATIETNIINFFITVSGTGVGAPVTTVNPVAINETLDVGTTTTVPLTISNNGQGPLFYDIDTTYFQQQLKVLAYTNGSDVLAYNNTITAINTYFTDYQLTTTNTISSTELGELLQNVNVLLVPAITDFNSMNLFNSFQTVLNDFVNSGGHVIFLGNFNWGDNPVLHSGFFNGFNSFNSGMACNVVDTAHPIMEGVSNPYNPIGITPMTFFDADLVRLVQQPGFDINPSDVVAFRQIGTGRAIYIGHDFGSEDPEGSLIISNTLKWVATQNILQWFAISSTSGTVGYPASETLTVTLDATNLVGGTYTTQIVINNNDPLAPSIVVPVTLTVIGVPAIEVSNTSLNYGNVIIGNTKTLEVQISNPGTDSLFLDISSSLPQFVVNSAIATVPPFGNMTLEITFVPSVIALLNGQIFVNNNVNDLIINVTGFGQGAPVIGVNPSSLETTLLAGETEDQTVTLTNTGAGPLEFTSNGGSTIPILAWTYQANVFNYAGVPAAIEATGLDYTLEETDTDNPTTMAALLQNKRVLLIPDQNFSSSSAVFSAMAPVLSEFVQNGGAVVYLATQCDFCMSQTGLFNGFIWAFLFNNPVNVLDNTHPLSTGLATTYISSSNSIAYFFSDPDVVSLTDVFTGGSTLSYRQFGNGKAIYVGDVFTEITVPGITMLRNALQWGGAPPSWISFDPTEGTNEVGESFTINVTFDATGLLAGVYTFDLILFTNDPLNPEVVIPCTMTVLAFPQVQVAAQPTYSCDGIVNFYDQTLNNPTSWTWDFGDGTTAGIQNPIHSYTESGNYTITLEACNDLGCDELVFPNLITVDFNSVYCDTINMPFSGVTTITDCHGVLRDSGGEQNYLAGANGVVTISPFGATQVSITFTEFAYLNIENADQIIIYDGPDINSPVLGFFSGTTLPNGGTVTSTGGSITIQELTFGWFGTDIGFTATWDCVIITTPPVPGFTSETTDNCLGIVDFTDATGNYPSSWSWDFGDGATSTDQDPQHSYLQSGTYNVVLTSCNMVGCESVTIPVTVSGVLYVNFTAPQYIQINSPIMFMDNTANSTYWQWNFGNGQTAVGQIANPVTFYNTLGVYTVTLTVTDSNGCVRSGSQVVTVVEDVSITDPISNTTLLIYPNPTNSGLVNLQIAVPNQSQALDLSIYDAIGKQVYAERLNSVGDFTHQINTAGFAKGMYWVALQSNSGLITQKLIVQ